MLKMLALSVSVLALMACSEQEMASAEAPVEAAIVEVAEVVQAAETAVVEMEAAATEVAETVQAEVAEASAEIAQ